MREPLTEHQQKVYSFIVGFVRKNGFPPTIREIQLAFNYKSSNSVVSQIGKIERKGYITRASSKTAMRARTMRIVDDIIGNFSIETRQLSKTLKDLKERGYKIELNEAIELLSALKVIVV